MTKETKELPVLPDHPEPWIMKWSALEIEAIQAYGASCAAHALQSQAERIKELELDIDVQAGSIEAVQAANSRLAAERDTLRAQLAESISNHEACKSANSMLLGELAAIAATEPVAFMWQHDETGRVGFVDPWQVENGWQAGNPRLKIIKPLFTHPMPAQDVTELVELLEFMWRDVSMNDYAFEKLEAALSKYKGAK